MTAVQQENSRESRVMGWVMLNPVRRRVFFILWRQVGKNININVADGRKKGSSFFGLHTKVWVQLTRLVVVSNRILSQHYHPRAVSCSNIQFLYSVWLKVQNTEVQHPDCFHARPETCSLLWFLWKCVSTMSRLLHRCLPCALEEAGTYSPNQNRKWKQKNTCSAILLHAMHGALWPCMSPPRLKPQWAPRSRKTSTS